MIPKIIHYCWFGRGKMPKLAQDCIKSWEKYCPEYQLKEWNEENFDLDLYPYAREAYDNKKFAFVTDVVRLYALYNEGGIYMDTDVEVIKPLDPFLDNVAFSGFEGLDRLPTGIMASEKGGQWVKDNLEYYTRHHFITLDGKLDLTTNVTIITDYMLKKGVVLDNSYQDFPGFFRLYPKTYFCPLSEPQDFSENTVTIHHFAGSWLPRSVKIKKTIGPYFIKIKPLYRCYSMIKKKLHRKEK